MIEKLFSFSATEIGYNHIKAEPSKDCEDASDHYDDELMHICVVADGHGSDNYPRTKSGSKFAVEVTIEQIQAFVRSIYNPNPENVESSKIESKELIDKLLHTNINEVHPLNGLSRTILNAWYGRVEKDVEENPFQEAEMINVSEKYKKRYLMENRYEKAYGCTLIAYVVTEEFCFGLQIGDGKCVVIDHNGTASEPIPWDENCQLNVTTSICDSDASEEFRFFVTDEIPAAVFCGSDGIDDSYANAEEMYALYRSILKIFIEHGRAVGESEIEEYLPVLTKRGSGDDVSIALIMDIQRVTELTPVFAAQTELFNLKNQLKEKQHIAAVNEEKEKSLTSKLSVLMRPGNRSLLDQQIYCQINELRLQMTQMDEEILTIKRKIDNLNIRMPVIVAGCDTELPEETKNIDNGNISSDITQSHSNQVEHSEVLADNSCEEPHENTVDKVEEISTVSVKKQVIDIQEMPKESNLISEVIEPQRIIISEKSVSIMEQIAKVGQINEGVTTETVESIETVSKNKTPEE